MPRRSFYCRPVGCTVLGAPWLRDCEAKSDAPVERDRFYPRHPRCARLRPPPSDSYPAGTARAPFVRRGATASVMSYAATYVSHPPVRGGVLDAPWLRDRRGGLDAPVQRGRQHPRHPRCARLHPPPDVCNPAGTARAPFHTGAPTLSVHPRREGVEALPYGGWGGGRATWLRRTNAGTNPSVTAQSAVTAPLSGEPRVCAFRAESRGVGVQGRKPRGLARIFRIREI